jgi:hypothetical protein
VIPFCLVFGMLILQDKYAEHLMTRVPSINFPDSGEGSSTQLRVQLIYMLKG